MACGCDVSRRVSRLLFKASLGKILGMQFK